MIFSLRDVARVADAAVGDARDRALEGLRDLVDRGDLRDADAADDARRADRAGADADLDGVRAGVAQRDGGLARDDVAGDDVDVREVLREPGHHVEDALGVAVRGVDDEDVRPRLGEGLGALVVVAAGDGGGDAEAVLRVAVDHREVLLHQVAHVGEGVEPDEFPVLVDERELALLGAAHDLVGLLQRGALRRGDGVLRHHLLDLDGGVLGVVDVLGGEDADDAAGVVEDREAGELVALLLARGEDLVERLAGVERDRRVDEAVEVVLHLRDLVGLLLDGEVLVDDADAALHRHRDRHRGLRDGVHRGGEERDVDADARGEARGEVGRVGEEVGVLEDEGHVVVGQALEGELGHELLEVFVLLHCGMLLRPSGAG